MMPASEPTGTGAGIPTILDELDQWRAGLAEYGLASPDHLAALERAVADARRGRLDQPPPPTLTVLLLGASGAGKSELLNALAGERIAVSHHVRPTTRRPTIYAHASLPPERLYDYGPVLGELAKAPGAYRTHTREELRHKILIDAPDIDSYETGHRDLVLRLMPAVDVALYVVTAYNYKDDIGWQTVLGERGRRGFAFVMNKWDSEGKPRVPAGSPDVDEDLRMLLQRGGWAEPVIFRTSARYWVARRTAEPEGEMPAPAGDQLPDLERWLSAGLSTSQIEQIQRRRRRSLWGALSAAVAAALPPDLEAAAWPAAARAELTAVREEGWQLLLPALHARARELAALRDRARRPESPGPFGLMQRAAGSLSGGAKNLGRLRQPLPAPGQPGLVSIAGQPSGEPAHGLDVTSVLSAHMGAFVERRLAGLEWRAREAHFPVEWLAARWREEARRVEPVLAEARDQITAELAARATGNVRRAAGVTAVIIAEAAVTIIVVIAAYRLGEAFLLGRYLNPAFALHFLVLLLCIFLLGQMLIALLAPRSERAFRSDMEIRVGSAWRKETKQLEATLAGFLALAAQLRTQGEELAARCGAETQQLTREITEASQGEPDTSNQLFGQFA